MPLLLLLMLGVPLIEIGLFIEIGGRIGLLWTIAIVIVTALVGSALLRHQGLGALNAARSAMAEQRLPIEQVFDGFCLLIAGAFLLTPGFLTDFIGFLLFVPPVRAVLGRWLWTQFKMRGSVHVSATGMHHSARRAPDDVVEAEFREIRPGDIGPGNGRSGAD